MIENKMPFHKKYDYIDEQLKRDLNKSRYEHSIGVMHTAACLAMRYKLDIEKAMLCGLVHDCTKNLNTEQQLSICKTNQIELTYEDMANPEILHAITAPIMAKNNFFIYDVDVLNAIRCHSTGKANMNNLDKALYIADFIEGGRFFSKDSDILYMARELAFSTDLNKTVAFIINNVLKWLQHFGNSIHSDTIKANDFYFQYLK